MVDTVRNATALQNLFRDDQAAGAIDPQDVRDLIVSALSALVGITSLGASQATATALTNAINVVTIVANGTGVVLSAGVKTIVMNRGANVLLVYPPLSGQIEALGLNIAFKLQAGQDAIFLCDPANPTQAYVTVSLNVTALPTALPSAAGVLWSNGGVLCIS